MDYEILGRLVFDKRRELKLSQEELAQKTNISRNYVSMIERGLANNISINIINKLATALGVSPARIMGKSESSDLFIPSALREFGVVENLSFEIVERLATIPRRGQEPTDVDGWRQLYQAISKYLE